MKEKLFDLWDNFREKAAALRRKIELQEEVPANEIEAYKVRIRNHRKAMYIRTAFLVVLTALAVLIGKYIFDHYTYHGYSVVNAVEKTDNVSEYRYVDGRILRYSSDGAALLKKNLDTIWNVTYSMDQPTADTCGSTVLLYDRNGTNVYIYSASKKIGEFRTQYPIVKAKVSNAGNVAAILADGDTTWIYYYAADGTKIASISTNMKSPGYPTDLALSGDGLFMTVSYLVVNEGTTGTHLAFYNFGAAGKNAEDNMVASEDFSGTIIPQVAYIGNSEAIAFRENGFTIYNGSGTPAKTKSVDFDDEIVSTFYDASHIGFIFKSADADHKYEMKIYSIGGALLSTSDINLIFDKVAVCDSQVLFWNSSEIAVYSLNGVCRFSGVLDAGDIDSVLRVGGNRYLVITDTVTETIKLK